MIFTDATYKYSASVTFQGVVIAFSAKQIQQTYQIGYSVLIQTPDNPYEDDSWTDFQLLNFPTELRPVGRGLLTIDFGPSGIPVADFPFQVVSDGQYIYIFRQSANNTLLVDRFVLDTTTGKLHNAWEVRYRRSRKQYIPAGSKDTFGSSDMNGDHFVEPTTELTMINNLSNGWFACLVLPTSLQSQSRWLILTCPLTTPPNPNVLSFYSILRSENGLFDLTDTLDTQTSPVTFLEPSNQFILQSTNQNLNFTSGPALLLYTKQEQFKDDYGKSILLKREARVMVALGVAPSSNVNSPALAILDLGVDIYGKLGQICGAPPLTNPKFLNIPVAPDFSTSTGLFFDLGIGSQLILPTLNTQISTGSPISFEIWINLSESANLSNNNLFIIQSAASENVPFSLAINTAGLPIFTVTKSSSTTLCVSGTKLDKGNWHHLAGTFDGNNTVTLYVNGQPYTTPATPPASTNPPQSGYLVGGSQGFSGYLDEVRVWKIARSQADIIATMNSTISNSDPTFPNLAGYWPLSAPQDPSARLNTVPNLVAGGSNGTLAGALWSNTSAPKGTSMPIVAWSSNGLAVAATLLGGTQTAISPLLFEGADGQVHLYWPDRQTNLFTGARYNTFTTRAKYKIPWGFNGQTNNPPPGTVSFFARQAGTLMNNPAVNNGVIAVTTNSGNTTGTLVLQSFTGLTETWSNLPLDLPSFLSVVNGEALQTSSLNPQSSSEIYYDYSNVQISPGNGSQTYIQPGPGSGSNIFKVAVENPPTNGQTGYVLATSAAPVLDRAGIDCWWNSVLPQPSLGLNQNNQTGDYVTILGAQQFNTNFALNRLNLRGSICLEVWIYPTGQSSNSTLLAYNYTSSNQLSPSQYVLGLDTQNLPYVGGLDNWIKAPNQALPPNQWTHLAADYKATNGVQLSNSRYLDAGKNASLNTEDGLTIEGWVKLDVLGGVQALASKWDRQSSKGWELFLINGYPQFRVSTPKGGPSVIGTATNLLSVNTWHHIAGVVSHPDQASSNAAFFDCSKPSYGTVTGSSNTSPQNAITVEAWVMLASKSSNSGTCSSTSQTIMMAGSDNTFSSQPFVLRLDNAQPTFFVANKSMVAPVSVANMVWTHLAATYDFSSGQINLYVNGEMVPGTTTGAGNSWKVDGTSTYIIGAFVQWGSGVPNDWNLNGYLRELRLWNVALSLEDIRKGMDKKLNGDEVGLVGYWPFSDRLGNSAKDFSVNAQNATLNNCTFSSLPNAGYQKLFVDGVVQAVAPLTSKVPVNTATLRFGSGRLGGAGDYTDFLQGTITDLRLWKVARHDWHINHFRTHNLSSNDNQDGLVSEWKFEVGEGVVVADDKSQNNATIKSANGQLTEAEVTAIWVPTSLLTNWTLYVNGVEVVTSKISSPLSPSSNIDNQFTAGALSVNSGTITSNFAGLLSNIRVWKNRRTSAQIQDNLHRPLTGDEEGLAGYWLLNEGSGKNMRDQTGYGNNALWYGQQNSTVGWSINSAPVSVEPPEIVNVYYSSTSTTSSVSTGYTPGVAEYGDMQKDADGKLFAVVKRAYTFVNNNSPQNLNLLTGFEIGDLDIKYIGQIQTKPTLIGFIEGAPPLPAENMTVNSPVTPNKYAGASSITLTEADYTTTSFSASRDNGFDQSYDVKAGLSIGANISSGNTFLSFTLMDWQLRGGIHAVFQHSLGWLNEATSKSQITKTADKTLQMNGTWFDNTYTFDTNDSIYYPSNIGYALVKSATADMYALQLKGTGTLVAYSIRPNPDIPEDMNIISFLINPQYIKNGTLDGWIGYQPDTSYSNLEAGQQGSYFKPLEGYALKQQIDREHSQLETYFDQFDAGAIGRRQKGWYGGASDPWNNDLGNIIMGNEDSSEGLSTEDWKKKMARRNLVNNYVWNRNLGFYAQTETFSTVRTESWGGSYDFTGKGGIYVELKMKVGAEASLDALWGGHIKTKVMKTKEEGASFGMNVKANAENFLAKIAPNQPPSPPPGAFPIIYNYQQDCPGKVSEYRFMAFYLAPNLNNFEEFQNQVVDQDWLERTGAFNFYDPDAAAMKEALSNANEVWRVLYRVTYVNRIPPLTPNQDGETASPDAHAPDLASICSNIWLIDVLPQSQVPLPSLSSAVDQLLTGLVNNPLWGSKLNSSLGEAKEDLMFYMENYYIAQQEGLNQS